ncbi:MAG: PKD domain-containing protein, partial [Synergistaceae bacterium]|nr:PKD domain-containing protein [Synergistaceae bacterium]
ALKITRPDITGTLSNGTVNGEYSGRLTVSGGTNPYTWEISSGTLPDGLKLTYSDDVATLSGTPTKVGSYKFAVRATDANKAVKTKSYTVKITQPTISGTLADSTLKAAYSKTLTVSGGVAPYKWTKSSGELPTGLKLKSSNTKATISGTPTTAGTFTFKIKVTDANKAAVTKSFTVKITQPTISGTLANGKRKANYSKSVTVKGGVSPYKWTKSSGTLPNGLKLTYSGTKATISGTPTKAGTFTFTLKVTDANKATATQSFTVNITQPTISGTLADGTVKTKYTGTLKVSGGTAEYTWVKASGTLPNGLKLTSSNTKATISGTPTKAGTFTFKIKVTDANGAATSKSFTVKIAEASASSKDSSSKTNSQSEKTSEKNQSEQAKSPDETQSSLPENSPETLEGEDTDVSIYAELKVVSEDIVESYDDKDSDMVKVKAGTPLRFTVGDWGTEVVDVVVYVDDKPVNSVEVSDEGKFTLPAEIVHDDFKVGLKAQSTTGKRESEELYIIAE